MRLTVSASLLIGSTVLRVSLEKKLTLILSVSLRLAVTGGSDIVIACPLEDNEPEPMLAPSGVPVELWPAGGRDVV